MSEQTDKLDRRIYFLYINNVCTEVSKKDWEKSWKEYSKKVLKQRAKQSKVD